MELSRVRFGSHLRSISETGETTSRKDLVFNFTRIRTNMKVCGLKISVMVREHTGEQKATNYAENILEIGMKIKSMVEVLSSIKMETDTMDTG